MQKNIDIWLPSSENIWVILPLRKKMSIFYLVLVLLYSLLSLTYVIPSKEQNIIYMYISGFVALHT
jgi:hypothetical protein